SFGELVGRRVAGARERGESAVGDRLKPARGVLGDALEDFAQHGPEGVDLGLGGERRAAEELRGCVAGRPAASGSSAIFELSGEAEVEERDAAIVAGDDVAWLDVPVE